MGKKYIYHYICILYVDILKLFLKRSYNDFEVKYIKINDSSQKLQSDATTATPGIMFSLFHFIYLVSSHILDLFLCVMGKIRESLERRK